MAGRETGAPVGHAGRGRPRGILVVAALMILFGLAEVATGITGNFLNVISAKPTPLYTFASVSIGSFYGLAGVLVLTMRKLGAALAFVLLAGDIVGRAAMVVTGLYPFSGVDAPSIVAGTAIAAVFAGYIAMRRSAFR